MKLIKSYQYFPVEATPFHVDLPLFFELYYGDVQLASYHILSEYEITYTYDESCNIPIITGEKEYLTMDDIYFLFTCRAFSKHSPYASAELKILDLNEYNPYYIARKTRGIMNGDLYWFKFSDDEIDSYEKAVQNFMALHSAATEGK